MPGGILRTQYNPGDVTSTVPEIPRGGGGGGGGGAGGWGDLVRDVIKQKMDDQALKRQWELEDRDWAVKERMAARDAARGGGRMGAGGGAGRMQKGGGVAEEDPYTSQMKNLQMKAMLRRDQEEGRKHALLMEGARGSGGFVQAHAMAQPGGGVYSPLDVRYGSPISALWGETSYGEGGGSPFKRGEQMYK